MRRNVTDLGIGAYLMMHGYKTVGRRGRNVFFELGEKDSDEFDKLTMEYLQSQFNKFDSYLLGLKRVIETANPAGLPVTDLGIGAYLMLHGYKVLGRKGKGLYFDVSPDDVREFQRLQVEYLGGPYHTFDSYLMALKKVGEYMPDDGLASK
jgi:hypothetical protein